MRRTPWLAAWLIVILGIVLMGCNGPNRSQSVSSASGFQLVATASPNVIRGANANTSETQGGCSTITVKVFDTNGQLVDGATVVLVTTLGRFPATPTRSESVAVTGRTTLGIATDVLCAKSERGTAIVTASVEDASTTVLITII